MTSNRFKFFSLYGVFLLAVLSLIGCNNGQQYALRATDTSNALGGEVSVSEDNLGNTTLDIEVENLDGQSSAEAPKYYVAWARNKSDTVRLGLLNVDDRIGELIATTDLDKFTVMITSEKFPDVSRPSDMTLLESQTIVIE
jgi:hypothetical protein